MEDKTAWLPVAAIIVSGIFFIWPVFERMQNEVTVYNMFCTKDRVNGVCTGEEQTANPTGYKVFPDQQSVISWVSKGPVTRFGSCAVRDVDNWRCQYEKAGQEPHLEYIMTDGNFVLYSAPPFSTGPFYTVSRWRWWMVKLSEMIGGKK